MEGRAIRGGLLYGGGKPKTVASLADICGAIRMRDVGPVAQHREVELARELLTHVVRGLAYSLWNRVAARLSQIWTIGKSRNFPT
jgi:hypothetical protein